MKNFASFFPSLTHSFTDGGVVASHVVGYRGRSGAVVATAVGLWRPKHEATLGTTSAQSDGTRQSHSGLI